MLEPVNENDDTQELNPNCTMKISIEPADVELTSKINNDYNKIINDSKKKALMSDINLNPESPASSLTGKTFFARKRVADDYVKSNTMVSTIDSIPPLDDELELQDVNSNYELKQEFSEGSQGIIRTAFDKSLKREVVVKSLKIDDSEAFNQDDKNLFVSEARIMAQLDHPSIIPLYGLHCGAESKLHLAMKHIHGKTLEKYLQDIVTLYKYEGVKNFDEKRSISTRIEYLIKVCEAIDYAHCKGVIHRDIKPENIMIGNYGEVYVMDWGLACLIDPEKFSNDEQVARVGEHEKNELVGTPCYIAPELIRGGACSPQSDIFSLGMMLFEIVTLKKAAPGKTLKEVLGNIVKLRFASFKHSFLKGMLSSDLKAIIKKATCESLSRRYKSAGDMAKDLKLYLMREETAARPDNILRKCMRAMINYKMVTSIVILSLLLCLASSTIYGLYAQNTLMKEQGIREAMLTNFQDSVSQRAHDMERIFFYFKTQLANLGYRGGQLLSTGSVENYRVYDRDDYLKVSTVPADYIYSPAYGKKISLDFSVFKLGNGSKSTDKMNKRVVALQPMLKHVMLKSDPIFKNKTENAAKKIIIDKGVTLSWIYIGLKNGSVLCYPGGEIYSNDFDPRRRPWYKKALTQKNGLVWSEPYKDALSSKIVISCSQCVYSKEGNFQGVVGMDISLDYIQKHMFGNKAIPGLKEYLLDKEGGIILSSNFKNKKAKTSKEEAGLIQKEFVFMKEFRRAVKQKLVQFEAIRYNTKYIFALNQLPSLGYYYIQQISEKNLRKAWGKSASYKK